MRNTLFLMLFATTSALAGPPGLAPRAEPPPRGPRPPMEAMLPPPPRLSAAEEAEVLALLEAQDPARLAELRALQATDEPRYAAEIARAARMIERLRGDPAQAKRALEMRDLHRELRERAKGLAALDEKAAQAERTALEALAGQLFELKQADRRERLQELRARIEELEAEIDQREADRTQIIDAVLRDLAEGPPRL